MLFVKCEFKTSLSAKDIFVYDSVKTIKSGMDNRGEDSWSYLYFLLYWRIKNEIKRPCNKNV